MSMSPLEKILIFFHSFLVEENERLNEEIRILEKKNERLESLLLERDIIDDNIDVGGAQRTE